MVLHRPVSGDIHGELHTVSQAVRSVSDSSDESDLAGSEGVHSPGSDEDSPSEIPSVVRNAWHTRQDRVFTRFNIRGKSVGFASAISGFVGSNGSGKTLAMVDRLAIPSLLSGRPVVSNFEIDHPLWVPLESWRQIPELQSCTLLLDEITAVLPSRQSASMPPELQRVLNQLRKVDVQVGWSAPHWARADVILREVTQAVTVCSGFRPDFFQRDPVTRKTLRVRGRRVPVETNWSPNRAFLWRTYDAVEWEEYSTALVEKAKPMSSTWYFRNRGVAQDAYGTLDGVALLDHVEAVGTCLHCGGRKATHRCNCA